MAHWKGILSLLLAILYLPAASLCLVERAGWLAADDCCTASAEKTAESPGEKACCALASATYKLNDTRADTPLAPLLAPVLLAAVAALAPAPAPARTVPRSDSPPELPATWQFACRTALPPRAPSFVS